MVEPTRYAAALEIYAITLETLKRENANHQKRVMVAQPVDKTSPNYVQDQDNDKNKTILHQLLATYIDHELELTQTVTQMHETRFKDKTAAKYCAEKAHSLEAEIKQLADEIIQHLFIKEEVQALSIPSQQHLVNVIKLGGFAVIKERLLNQALTAQDLTALAKHVHLKTQKITFSIQQARDRGGRSC